MPSEGALSKCDVIICTLDKQRVMTNCHFVHQIQINNCCGRQNEVYCSNMFSLQLPVCVSEDQICVKAMSFKVKVWLVRFSFDLVVCSPGYVKFRNDKFSE